MKWAKDKKRSLASIIFAGLVVVAVASVFSQVKSTNAAPYLGCSPNGYIVKDNGSHTDIQAIDMVTGQGSPGPTVQNHKLNAIGYNPKDNNFYAWDLQNGVYVRLDANFNVLATFTPTQIGLPGLTTNDIFAGDVDEDGFHWFFRVVGATTFWYKVDANQATPTHVDSGSGANPADLPDTLSEGTDWAYVPGTNKLYRGMDNGTSITIVAFDRTSKTYSVIGKVTNITAGGSGGRNMGAVYADPAGNFYMSSNGTGILWRIDLDAPSGPGPTYTAVQLDAADVGSNDGARCALASIPIDFGDAPSGYDTLIADDGPRHSVINFNIATSTAPLMLGTNVDIDIDGFPGTQATGDDDDHQGSPFVDDERGVTSIVATPGTPTALAVPVKVTNNSSSVATLAGWIDLDSDTVFEAGERVTASIPANSGTSFYQLTFPSTTFTANTYARFRVFSGTVVSPLPTGAATGGEVEDVLVQVGTYDANKTSNPKEGSTVDPGKTVTYTISIQNTGATALTNLKVDDDLSDVLDDATLEGAPTISPASAGSAAVNNNLLEFRGNVGVGQTVMMSYTVKIKAAGSLGSAILNNFVLAAHSTSCHPTVSGGRAIVSDPDCKTSHTVSGLANTGSSIVLPLLLSSGSLAAAGATWYLGRKGARLSISPK
ncbi:MAG TPA: GEVED domain-containing protein [Nevskiaceae bacterium]|nr:GEVED domain-containing protein [Nevskiaceae bacterium]